MERALLDAVPRPAGPAFKRRAVPILVPVPKPRSAHKEEKARASRPRAAPPRHRLPSWPLHDRPRRSSTHRRLAGGGLAGARVALRAAPRRRAPDAWQGDPAARQTWPPCKSTQDTTGLKVGEPVQPIGQALTAQLGPGLLGSVLDRNQPPAHPRRQGNRRFHRPRPHRPARFSPKAHSQCVRPHTSQATYIQPHTLLHPSRSLHAYIPPLLFLPHSSSPPLFRLLHRCLRRPAQSVGAL